MADEIFAKPTVKKASPPAQSKKPSRSRTFIISDDAVQRRIDTALWWTHCKVQTASISAASWSPVYM